MIDGTRVAARSSAPYWITDQVVATAKVDGMLQRRAIVEGRQI